MQWSMCCSPSESVSAFFSWRGGWWGSCNFCGRPAIGEKIIAALQKAGVEFLDDGQGVRLKPPKAKRKPK
jgi:hypothetical protein